MKKLLQIFIAVYFLAPLAEVKADERIDIPVAVQEENVNCAKSITYRVIKHPSGQGSIDGSVAFNIQLADNAKDIESIKVYDIHHKGWRELSAKVKATRSVRKYIGTIGNLPYGKIIAYIEITDVDGKKCYQKVSIDVLPEDNGILIPNERRVPDEDFFFDGGDPWVKGGHGTVTKWPTMCNGSDGEAAFELKLDNENAGYEYDSFTLHTIDTETGEWKSLEGSVKQNPHTLDVVEGTIKGLPYGYSSVYLGLKRKGTDKVIYRTIRISMDNFNFQKDPEKYKGHKGIPSPIGKIEEHGDMAEVCSKGSKFWMKLPLDENMYPLQVQINYLSREGKLYKHHLGEVSKETFRSIYQDGEGSYVMWTFGLGEEGIGPLIPHDNWKNVLVFINITSLQTGCQWKGSKPLKFFDPLPKYELAVYDERNCKISLEEIGLNSGMFRSLIEHGLRNKLYYREDPNSPWEVWQPALRAMDFDVEKSGQYKVIISTDRPDCATETNIVTVTGCEKAQPKPNQTGMNSSAFSEDFFSTTSTITVNSDRGVEQRTGTRQLSSFVGRQNVSTGGRSVQRAQGTFRAAGRTGASRGQGARAQIGRGVAKQGDADVLPQVDIYPKPFATTLEIHSPEPIGSVRILSIDGRVVYECVGQQGTFVLLNNLGDTPAGPSIVEVLDTKGAVVHRELVTRIAK